MVYKVVKNNAPGNDCELCIFRGCKQSWCPLKPGWYFADVNVGLKDFTELWKEK
jgi:hypothetical protein